MLPSRDVVHLPLKGLHPDDAYGLSVRVLESLSIDRKRARFAEMCELLRQLDCHPLSIQLVLPSLRDNELEIIRSRFSELLPTFVDDRESGRNRSLLASLEYSLQRLTSEQRIMLLLLAPFEGGADESELLRITDIPEQQWAALRSALEQAALLMPQMMHPGNPVPYLRFHPVLTPYLRTLPGANNPMLEFRYALRYYALLKFLYNDDSRVPQLTRTLVRTELPNFRRALDMFITGQVQVVSEAAVGLTTRDIVADMADSLSSFLKQFGMTRLANQVWRQVTAEAATTTAATVTLNEYYAKTWLITEALQSGKEQLARGHIIELLTRLEAQGSNKTIGFRERARLLRTLAESLSKTGDYVGAEVRTREALGLFDEAIEANPEDTDLRAKRGTIILDLGNLRLNRLDLDKAESLNDEVLMIATQYDDARLYAYAMSLKATLLARRQKYSEAEEVFSTLGTLFAALGEPNREAELATNLGATLHEQGRHAEAESYYRRALTLIDSLQDKNGLGILLYNLGLLRLPVDPEEAKRWFKRALETGQLHGLDEIGVLNSLAESILCRSAPEPAAYSNRAEAREHATRAMQSYRLLGPRAGSANFPKLLAEIEEQDGHPEAAQKYRELEQEYKDVEAWLFERADLLEALSLQTLLIVRGRDLQGVDLKNREAAADELLEKIPWQGTIPSLRRILSGERDRESLTNELPLCEASIIHILLDAIEGQT